MFSEGRPLPEAIDFRIRGEGVLPTLCSPGGPSPELGYFLINPPPKFNYCSSAGSAPNGLIFLNPLFPRTLFALLRDGWIKYSKDAVPQNLEWDFEGWLAYWVDFSEMDIYLVFFWKTVSSRLDLRTEISARHYRETTRTDVPHLFCFHDNPIHLQD